MPVTTNFVFVHGGGMGSWVWAETVAAVQEHSAGLTNCVTLDVPGCGAKRQRDTSALEFDDIARELITEIQTLGLRDIVVVGHSQAGMLIPHLVEQAPYLFTRLIYVTCSAPPPGMSIMELLGSGLAGERDDRVGWPADLKTTPMTEVFRAMFCNDMSRTQQAVFLSKLLVDSWPLRTYTHSDWRYDHLDSVPASYVICQRDRALPAIWQQRFASTLRVDRTVTIDAGHQVMNTHSAALARILLAESKTEAR